MKINQLLLGLLDRFGLLEEAVYWISRLRYMRDRATVESNARILRSGLPDGLPSPDLKMAFLVTSQFSLNNYFENGQLGARVIREILARHGYSIEGFNAILDFGCGAGRILRHWYQLDAVRRCGTDYNPYLVEWCRQAYPFAEIARNESNAALPYEDGSFDFIYTISVFTHLVIEQQQPLMRDLIRILKPGGVLYLTVHGESYKNTLDEAQLAVFNAGRLAVRYGRYAGTNVCGAFHPESYVREVLARDLECLEYIPLGALDAKQDVYLLRKPRSTIPYKDRPKNSLLPEGTDPTLRHGVSAEGNG